MNSAKQFSDFERIIGIEFKNKALLETAFTHRSYLNENKGVVNEHNERLEFLGDAVLELVVTEFLFAKYPNDPEGELTSYRAALVRAETLGEVADKIRVNDFLLLSRGESKDTGRARQYILANAIEAIIGALYLDQGYELSKKFILENLLNRTDEIVSGKTLMDAKSHFQEKAQEACGITPTYKIMKEEGPDHDKKFTSGLFLKEDFISEGLGQSKQEAEQEAARNGLKVKGW